MARACRVHAGMIRSGGTAMVLAADSTAAAGLEGQCTPTVAAGPAHLGRVRIRCLHRGPHCFMVRQPAMLRRAWFGRVPLHIATSMGQGPDVLKSLNALAHAHGRHARQRGACYPQCLISFVLSGSHAIRLVGVGVGVPSLHARFIFPCSISNGMMPLSHRPSRPRAWRRPQRDFRKPRAHRGNARSASPLRCGQIAHSVQSSQRRVMRIGRTGLSAPFHARHPFTLDLCAAGAHSRYSLPLTFLRMH